jgi:hypothetical protein
VLHWWRFLLTHRLDDDGARLCGVGSQRDAFSVVRVIHSAWGGLLATPIFIANTLDFVYFLVASNAFK